MLEIINCISRATRRKIKSALIICFFMAAFSCSKNNGEKPQPPVGAIISLADPTIFADKGVYYLYGTADPDGFKVYTSRDKLNWKKESYVLRKGTAYGTQGFWAPQVFSYNGLYYMAYTANENIAIASAQKPTGNFTNENKPLPSSVKQIDPFVFVDGGKIYLYHVRLNKGNKIYVAELNADFTSIKEETLRECIAAEDGWENTQKVSWPVAEGPTVFKHENLYYLVYSANDFRNPDYAVGYAVSESPVGPWKKYEGNPVISKSIVGINGTGHGDILFEQDKMQYVFHTHESNEKVGNRKTAVIDLVFKNVNGKNILTADAKTFSFLRTAN